MFVTSFTCVDPSPYSGFAINPDPSCDIVPYTIVGVIVEVTMADGVLDGWARRSTCTYTSFAETCCCCCSCLSPPEADCTMYVVLPEVNLLSKALCSCWTTVERANNLVARGRVLTSTTISHARTQELLFTGDAYVHKSHTSTRPTVQATTTTTIHMTTSNYRSPVS